MAELEALQTSTLDVEANQPPEPLLIDYIEMCYLVIVIIIGLPLNIHVFFGLLCQLRKTAKNSVKVRHRMFCAVYIYVF